MPGTLFVVATPIGNLDDITLRALRVLREVDVIAAEDTRHTARLLNHFAITTPTVSFHEHNIRTRVPQLLKRLEGGQSIALVTDAGTPGVSDPGVELVQACIASSIGVDPLPGPSAPLAAAIASGFSLQPMTIYGFAPAKAQARSTWMKELSAVPGTLTFFEAPHRMEATLVELSRLLGDRPIVVARELTKIHQEFVRGDTPGDVIGHIPNMKGEFTIVLGPRRADASVPADVSDSEIHAEFGRMAECAGLSRRDTVAAVAKKFGKPVRDVYAAVERAKSRSIDQ